LVPHGLALGRCLDCRLNELGEITHLIFEQSGEKDIRYVRCIGPMAIILAEDPITPASLPAVSSPTPPPAEHATSQQPEVPAPVISPPQSTAACAPPAEHEPPFPATNLPLTGRVLTCDITAADGTLLAYKGQIIDEALVEKAARMQRRVALVVHSRPALGDDDSTGSS
jgi:hypothetical protein